MGLVQLHLPLSDSASVSDTLVSLVLVSVLVLVLVSVLPTTSVALTIHDWPSLGSALNSIYLIGWTLENPLLVSVTRSHNGFCDITFTIDVIVMLRHCKARRNSL